MTFQVPDREGDMFVVTAEDCDSFQLFCRPCGLGRSLRHQCPDPDHPVHNAAPIASILNMIATHRRDPSHMAAVIEAGRRGRTFHWDPSTDPVGW